MKLQRINIIDLTWLSDWVTSQSCRVLLCLAESSCNPTHNRFRWVRINWQYKIGGRNGCFFFPSKSDIDTFYQFTVALIVFLKKYSWLILAWSCWRMFSQKGARMRTRLTPTSSSIGSCQHILTAVPKTTFSSGPGHGSWVPRQVLGRCGNNSAHGGKWAAVYLFHLLCDTVDAEVGKPVRWSLLASPKNRSSNGVCSPAVLRHEHMRTSDSWTAGNTTKHSLAGDASDFFLPCVCKLEVCTPILVACEHTQSCCYVVFISRHAAQTIEWVHKSHLPCSGMLALTLPASHAWEPETSRGGGRTKQAWAQFAKRAWAGNRCVHTDQIN